MDNILGLTFQHFKGSTYLGWKIVNDPNTGAPTVYYQSDVDGRIWKRHVDGFFQPVECTLGLRPRFIVLKDGVPVCFSYADQVWDPKEYPAMCLTPQQYRADWQPAESEKYAAHLVASPKPTTEGNDHEATKS